VMLGEIVWGMPILDVAAVVIAVASITVAIIETRRNNRTSLSLLDAVTSMRGAVNENDGKWFHELSLVLRNNGLPLHDVKAAITFAGIPPNTGTCSIGLREKESTQGKRELGKGMIVTYRLRSYDLDETTIAMLRRLQSPRRQHAALRIYSQDYLAYSISIGGWWDKWADYMNQWIHLVNRCTMRRIGKTHESHDVVEHTIRIQPLKTLAAPMRWFIKALDERMQ
jgi:hypothetical protein